MINYHYDNLGYYLGFQLADESPLEPGVYLVPARATTQVPPEDIPVGKRLRFLDGEWALEDIPAPPPPPPDPTLVELKQQKIDSIKYERDDREVSGFEYNGVMFDSDQRSTDRIQIATLAAQSALLTATPFSIDWTARDNTVVTLDANGMIGLASAFAAYGAYLHETAKQLKQAVYLANTKEELEAIVWPT